MKVLWFNHRDFRHPKAGGAERTIHEVSRRLVKMGYEVSICSVNPGNLENYEIVDGVVIRRIRGNIRAHLLVPKTIRKVNPDVIIDDLAHVVPWCSPLFSDKKVVVFFRHLHARTLPGQVGSVSSTILSQLEKTYRFLYRTSTFVTELETGMNDLSALGIKKDKIKQILPGIDRNAFKPCSKTHNPTLLYFAGLKDYKRPWFALDLLKSLNRGDVRLRILGDGPSLDRVREICDDEGLSSSVEFLGKVSDEKLQRIVCESWINLHFSKTEGFGLTLIESASSGTPTVALDAPGVSETLRKFGLGEIQSSVDLMAVAIREIFNDYKSWSERVYNNSIVFSWDRTAKDWSEVLGPNSIPFE